MALGSLCNTSLRPILYLYLAALQVQFNFVTPIKKTPI